MVVFIYFVFSLSFVRPYPYQRPSPGYDVLHYNLYFKIRSETRNIVGVSEFTVEIKKDYLNKIKFNAEDLMIDSILVLNRKIFNFYYPDSDLVEFSLPTSAFRGETLSFKVFFYKFYPGNLPIEKMRGVFFHPEGMVFTFSEPQDARRIFPCWDEPYDKATLKIRFNVPYKSQVASNGLLMQKIDYPHHDSSVYVFYESHPIATYLIAFSVYHDYEILSDYYQDKHLLYYVVDRRNRIVAESLKALHREAIEFFSRKFLNYPFSKYGVASVFDFPGGMENQTITFVNPNWWNDTQNIYKLEYGFIHELAHQWFGDFVTPSDWKEIWLNEGFASYMEILWAEYKYGKKAALKRLKEFKNQFFNVDTLSLYPIYDPRDSYFNSQRFVPIIYKKGAYVLHMLRKIMGDNEFINALRDYLINNSYGNVTIGDFQISCEKYYGNSLYFFFEEWLLRAKYPIFKIYDTTYQVGSGVYVNEIKIKQKAPPYTVKMPVALCYSNNLFLENLWIDDTLEIYKVYTNFVPDSIVYNFEDEILCKILKQEYYTEKKPVEDIYVFNDGKYVYLGFQLNKRANVELKVLDCIGRNVRTLIKETLDPGSHIVLWTGKNTSGRYSPSGTYFFLFNTRDLKVIKKFVLVK
ncbi:MAG: M1 family aminopeptidase [Candidatus Hydrothermales bacterium]